MRSFSLSGTVDPDSVVASYDADVRELELIKEAETKPRKIKVPALE